MSDAARVVIVGSGIAGIAVAERLVRQGVESVVMLEAGPKVAMYNRRSWLDMVTSTARPYDFCEDDAGDFTSSGPMAWDLRGSRLFIRGGSLIHWGGWALRMKPEDFRRRSLTGKGADWPVPYDELEAHYCEAEALMQVAGDSAVTAPPRSQPFPFRATPYAEPDAPLIGAFKRLGYSYEHLPISRNTEVRPGIQRCRTVATCKYCPIGGRYTSDQTLDRLERSGRFELRLGAAVQRIVMASKTRAAAVEYTPPAPGGAARIEAEAVVVCAGAVESPKLLLESRSPFWPDGIGNDRGQVGRNLLAHPVLVVAGTLEQNARRFQDEVGFPTLCSRHFDSPAHQADGKLFLCRNNSKPAVNLPRLMLEGRTVTQIEQVVAGPGDFELWGFLEELPYPDNRVTVAPGRTKVGTTRTAIQAPIRPYSEATAAHHLETMKSIVAATGCRVVRAGVLPRRPDHAMGTCRMSVSPEDGVVDRDLRVHETDNVYVCSNGAFPSGGAVNPSLTLAALALRLGDRLAQGLGRASNSQSHSSPRAS